MSKRAGLLFVLLALILVNALDACAADFNPAPKPVHPCCPRPTRPAPAHCAKLGCSMADFAILPHSQNPDSSSAAPALAPASIASPVAQGFAVISPVRRSFDRLSRLHQLLI